MLRLREDIPLWPDGRKKCCTLSFDDGTVEDIRITQMLRDRGLHATFNLNTGLMGQCDHLEQAGFAVDHDKLPADRIAEVYNGFEVAVHGYTHAHLGRVPSSMAAYEITRCKVELEDIVHAPVRGMAWPINFRDPDLAAVRDTARACGICYARTTRRTYDCVGLPADWLAWDAACSYVQPQLDDVVDKFLAPLGAGAGPGAAPYREPYLLYVWGHGYEATGHKAWGTLEGFLDRVSGYGDIWYASNIEVYDYVMALRSLVYSATGDHIYNPSRLDVWMQVDGKPLHIPSGQTVNVLQWV